MGRTRAWRDDREREPGRGSARHRESERGPERRPEERSPGPKDDLTVEHVLYMQRTSGNAVVARMLKEFPHRAEIEERLGATLPGEAVVDPEGCKERGTDAFTDGTTTHFAAEAPTLRVAAHEAAHTLQHSGRSGDQDLGAEGHAGAVADRVAGGEDARSLVGSSGASVAGAVRDFTEVPVSAQSATEYGDAGVPLRVADGGKMAVAATGKLGSKQLWADPALVSASSKQLEDAKSTVRLKSGSSKIKGSIGSGGELTEVLPDNVASNTSGSAMEIWADCGKAARDVIGVGGGSGQSYDKVSAEFNSSGKVVQTDSSSPVAMADEIIKATLGFGWSSTLGWWRYGRLKPGDKDAFDKKTGINKYARPDVGEGFAMATGGEPDPVAPSGFTWNFHWAGVVMRSGEDVVTLENYSVSKPMVQNDRWKFQMYGPASKAGQTFHEQHEATHQHGTRPSTLKVGER